MIEDTFDFAARAIARALGDEVTWKPGTAEEKQVYAVFSNGFDRVQSGDVRISSKRPEIQIPGSVLPSEPARGDRVEIRNETFEVANPKRDAEAVSWNLVLKRVD